MNYQTMNRQRKFILISAAVGIISVFLPWTTISAGAFGMSMTQNTNGFHGEGIAVFLCFIAGCILAFTGDPAKPLDRAMWMGTLLAGSIAVLCMVIAIASSSNNVGGFGFVDAGYGFGIWIALAASIVMPGAAWYFRNPGDSLKSGLEVIKKNISMPANTTSTSTPGSTTNPANGASKIAELERLIELKNQGKISEEEYQALKSRLH